jgi:hypothetical protein
MRQMGWMADEKFVQKFNQNMWREDTTWENHQGEWDGWQMRNLCRNLIRTCRGEIPQGRIRHTQEDTINLDPKSEYVD